MTTLLSSPDLRFNIFDALTGQQGLTTFDTAKLPNGALAYVNASGARYRFDRYSAAAASYAVVVPSSGIGRWILEAIGSGALSSAVATVGGTVTTAASVANTWMALGNGAYSLVTNGDLFDIDSSTGIVTYTGPTQNYFIQCSFTVSAATPLNIEAAVSSSATGTLLNTTTSSVISGLGLVGDDNESANIATFALAQVATGTTFRGVLRNADGTVTMSTQKFQMAFIPAP